MNAMPLALATVILGTGAAMVAGPAAAAPSNHTKVISSCTAATYRPQKYVLSCADANTQITHATYSSWTANSARGHGTFVYNTCRPSCADGTFKQHPVTFTLGRARTVSGKRLFTRMLVSYAGLTEAFQMPTSNI
jgi:hypothetical protein